MHPYIINQQFSNNPSQKSSIRFPSYLTHPSFSNKSQFRLHFLPQTNKRHRFTTSVSNKWLFVSMFQVVLIQRSMSYSRRRFPGPVSINIHSIPWGSRLIQQWSSISLSSLVLDLSFMVIDLYLLVASNVFLLRGFDLGSRI